MHAICYFNSGCYDLMIVTYLLYSFPLKSTEDLGLRGKPGSGLPFLHLLTPPHCKRTFHFGGLLEEGAGPALSKVQGIACSTLHALGNWEKKKILEHSTWETFKKEDREMPWGCPPNKYLQMDNVWSGIWGLAFRMAQNRFFYFQLLYQRNESYCL